MTHSASSSEGVSTPPESSQSAEFDYIEDDDELVCEHLIAAVILDVNGDHFCARCNTEWWEDSL